MVNSMISRSILILRFQGAGNKRGPGNAVRPDNKMGLGPEGKVGPENREGPGIRLVPGIRWGRLLIYTYIYICTIRNITKHY